MLGGWLEEGDEDLLDTLVEGFSDQSIFSGKVGVVYEGFSDRGGRDDGVVGSVASIWLFCSRRALLTGVEE